MKGKQNTQPGVVVAPRPQSQNARGSTPPQQRGQDDFQARSPHAIQFQPPIQHMMAGQPNMQHQPQTFQRPPRIQGSAQFFPPSVRPISIRPSHPSPQQNPMYQSPPTGTQMMPFVSPQGQPTFIPQQQQYVQQQNEFTTTPVVSGQIQFRPVVPQQVAGQFAPVPSPAFSQQQAPYGMQQTIYTQPQPYYAIFKAPTPVPQQQPPRPTEPKREKKIIRIKDPNQDNRDVTQEILMAGTQSGSGTPNSTPDASGRSSSSSTPPVNLHNDAGAQFAMQVAATLDNDKPASNKSSQQASKAASVAVTVDQVQQNSESKLIETSRGLVELKIKQAVVQPSEIAVEKKTPQPQAVDSQTKSNEALHGDDKDKCLSEEMKSYKEQEHIEINEVEPKPEELECEVLKQGENASANNAEKVDDSPIINTTNEDNEVSNSNVLPSQVTSEASEMIVENGLKSTPDVELKEELSVADNDVSKSLSSETVTDNKNVPTELEKTDGVCTEDSITQEVASEVSTLPDEQKINGHEQQSVTEKVTSEPTKTGAESQVTVKDAMPKKKKKNKYKEFDKKDTSSDLMDAYTERPVKVEPPPVEDKEVPEVKAPSPPIEEQTPVEEKSWEDKEDLFAEESLESEEDGIDEMEPEVPAGKLTYDREFLLKFQYEDVCKEKPEGLPDIEVVLDAARGPQKLFANNRMQGADFAPSWMKQGRQGNQRHNVPSGARKAPPRKVILPAAQEVKLKRSENAWVRPKDKNQGSPDEAKTAELYRKVTSILNKLTPQKFQTLTNQILELEIDTPDRLEGVIDRIFEKAISEPGFSVAYANMCNCLTRIKVKFQIEDKEGKEPKEGQLSFRKILLNKCQKEFEKEKSEESAVQAKMDALTQQGLTGDELKLKKAELEEEELKMRRRSLGNIRFIGELFKLKMLTENIMHDCVVKLLRSNDEESYECLCKLLSTIGKDLDHKKAKMRFDQYFDQINKIIHSRRTSSRVRFMMIDVVDLRKNNWVPRREDNNPKTIDQIHKEAQEQEKKTTMMIQQAKMQKRESGRGGRDSPRNVGVPQADDGWTSVAKGGAKKADIDPKKFQNISKQRHLDEGNISLGPGGRGYGSWARGSSGGSGPGSVINAGGAGEQPANRYSALVQVDPRRSQGSGRQPGAGRRDLRSPVPGASGKGSSERERALEAVRRQTSRESEAKPSYERASSTPGSESVEIGVDPEARASPSVQELSEDEVRLKTEATLKEFLNIKDFKEAIQCFKDLGSPSMSYMFVATALASLIEKHESDRLITSQLFSMLLKDSLVTVDQFIKGVDEVLAGAEDMAIDVPHIWRYLGELIGYPVAEGHLPLQALGASLPRIQKSSARKMLADVLLIAVKHSNEENVCLLWEKSGLQWSTFFSSDEEAKEFLQNKNLEFTLQKCRTSSPAQHTSRIQEELRELILKRKARNEEVFEWIDKNVEAAKTKQPPFIRSLVVAVCEASATQDGSSSVCKCDQDLLKSRKVLLQKYIDGNSMLELHALYALQSLAVSLDHPPGFLKSFFDSLYDEDIITEDTFYAWEKSNDSAESKGKGPALKSTTEFFRWLRSAAEESGDEN